MIYLFMYSYLFYGFNATDAQHVTWSNSWMLPRQVIYVTLADQTIQLLVVVVHHLSTFRAAVKWT